METFWSAFGLILVTEIADKSRVIGLLLVTAFRSPGAVFLGMSLAYAVLMAAAVALGGLLPGFLPVRWVQTGAGGLLILLGAAGLFFAEQVEDRARNWIEKGRRWGPFLASFAATALGELADRTQIALAALSAQSGRPLSVYAGAMGAMTVLNLLTVSLGDRIARRFQSRSVHRFAAACFILFGALLLAAAWRGAPPSP